jgi:hypothetical protein
MNFTEIVILDYIDTWEQEAVVYVHTKDKRMSAVHDVVSNPTIDNNAIYIDFMQWGKRMTFVMPREDFSHLEYYYKDRHKPITKQDFDELNSFIDEQIEDFTPAETLREP